MKKLISFDDRASQLIDYKSPAEKKGALSAIVNDAVLDEYLPVYADIRKDALYYLDYMRDGAKDWKGAKLYDLTKKNADEKKVLLAKETIARGIDWMKNNHHIKNGSVIADIYGHMGEEAESIQESLSVWIKKKLDSLRKKMMPEYNPTGLYDTASYLISHWEDYWDMDETYIILGACVVYCPLKEEFKPQEVLRYLQNFESTYILQII